MQPKQAVLFTEEEKPNLPKLSSRVRVYKLDVDLPEASPLVSEQTRDLYRLMGKFLDRGIRSPPFLFNELYLRLSKFSGHWLSNAKVALSAYAKEFLNYRPVKEMLTAMGLLIPTENLSPQDLPAYVLYLSIDDSHSVHWRFAGSVISTLFSLKSLASSGYRPLIVKEEDLSRLREISHLLLKAEALHKLCLHISSDTPTLFVAKDYHRHNFEGELEFLKVPLLSSPKEAKGFFADEVEAKSLRKRITDSLGVMHISEVLSRVVSNLEESFRSQTKEERREGWRDPFQEMFEDY